VKDPLKKVILCFNVDVPADVGTIAKDLEVKVFSNEIIYRLVEEYKEWVSAEKASELKRKEANVTRPCEIRILKGTVFRQHSPAVFGVEILRGTLKAGVLMVRGGKRIDHVKGIEKEGKQVSEAKKGDKVAVSMENVTVGRHVNEGDVLTAVIPESDMKILREIFDTLSEDEKELLQKK
jgi:translation initiation factor 5B